jgi:hypothetical protein
VSHLYIVREDKKSMSHPSDFIKKGKRGDEHGTMKHSTILLSHAHSFTVPGKGEKIVKVNY